MLWFISNTIYDIPVYSWNLNTSYVMVHPHTVPAVSHQERHLNTSYVMVHHKIIYAERVGKQNLNTSYVMVHLGCNIQIQGQDSI